MRAQFNFKLTRSVSTTVSTIFDRNLKRRQRKWCQEYMNGDNYYDYLREEGARRLIDRLQDITRSFPYVLELGSHNGHFINQISRNEETVAGIETLVQSDSILPNSQMNSGDYFMKNNVESYFYEVDEEKIPFEEKSFDLVVSSLALHWVNDLPSTLRQIKGKPQ